MPMLRSVLESRVQELAPELERVYTGTPEHPIAVALDYVTQSSYLGG